MKYKDCCGKDQCTGCTDVMPAQRAWRWIRKD